MRPRLSRRGVLLAAPLALVALLGACGFGPIVRSMARSRAARRHVDLEIQAVRPGWFAVRLVGVLAHPQAMPSVQARIDEVRVGLGWLLRVERLDLQGVAVNA